jgi:hypothetical protein
MLVQGQSVGIGGRDGDLLFMHVYLRFVMYTTLPSCDSPVTVMASFGDVDGSADAIMDVFLLLPPGRLFICTFGGPTSGLRVQGRIIVLAAGYCQLVRHQN